MGLETHVDWPFTTGCTSCPPNQTSCVSCETNLPIEMVGIDELEHELTYDAVDAPAGLIQRFIKEAAIHVARDTKALKRKVTIDIQSGVRDYYPCQEDGERWHYALQICICNECIRFDVPPCCDTPCQCSLGRFGWFDPSKGQINLSWMPSADIEGGITVEMVAVPTKDACKLDKWFVEVYGEAVQALAASKIHKIQGSRTDPYGFYDPQLSAEKFREYIYLLSRHKHDHARLEGIYETHSENG